MNEDPDIKWNIKETDIEWNMVWSDGVTPDEMIFEVEQALALLLINGVILTNSYWQEKDLPTNIQASMFIFVNCSVIFAWGCADGEDLPYASIEKLYRMWRKDPMWGSAVWCMVTRNEMPQKPVEDRIREIGIWDLDSLNLEPNGYEIVLDNSPDLWMK